mmetsp:Transcript_130811/g.237941  ORF Transcript_130811/g.237941 Transcript_130811/m.237941 type:complete len:202 (-) Transcript_130811:121-726(-)
MTNLMQICLVSYALTVSGSSCLGRCGIALNTGSVGSCSILPCSTSRGPTTCSWGTCYCKEGYCRYPATTLHVQSRTCRQRAGDDSCHVSGFCYNAGLTTTSCSSGLCFCKFGYQYDCDKKECFYAPETMALSMGWSSNMTQEQMAEMADLQKEGQRETLYNLLVAAMWVSAAFGLIAGVVVLRSRLRGAKVEEADYAVLAD